MTIKPYYIPFFLILFLHPGFSQDSTLSADAISKPDTRSTARSTQTSQNIIKSDSAGAKKPEKFNVWRMFEVPLFIWTAYHVQAVPHELVHVIFALPFGNRLDAWHVGFFVQAVELKQKDGSERTAPDRVVSSMSAPIFSRFACDLPRWIYRPAPGTWWLRWTSAYWLMSYTTTFVTAAGSWASFANGKETGWDFYNTATAATHHKGGRAAFLGCITGLLTLDAILMRREIAYNVKTLIGKETAYPRKKSTTVSLHLLPGGFLACGEF